MLIEFIQKGGIFMYPIIGCSIISLGIFLERMWALRKGRVVPEKLITNILKLSEAERFDELTGLCRAGGLPPASICEILLKKREDGAQALKESAIDAGRNVVFSLEKHIEGLSTIANVSTLLGLLGTISGMIKIFSVISLEPIVDPARLAGGISEALYTTAAGLSVAIPTFIGYKYLSGRVTRLALILEQFTGELMEYLLKGSNSK